MRSQDNRPMSMHPHSAQVRALTLDLDDTLWPVGPVIAHAERQQRRWLEQHAPATAGRFDAAALRRLRAEVEQRHPELAHDLSALRRRTLQHAVAAVGEPAALAEQAFEVFYAARQQVDFYPDAMPALARLARRFPLLSLTNGNADLRRVGIHHHFVGALSASDLGAAKPDPRLFAEACRRLGHAADRVLHVGDDLGMDVLGATAAGMAAVWLRRPGSAADLAAQAVDQARHPLPPQVHVVADLTELADWLGC
jgi:putative hydrolase of the HAD superfamily